MKRVLVVVPAAFAAVLVSVVVMVAAVVVLVAAVVVSVVADFVVCPVHIDHTAVQCS